MQSPEVSKSPSNWPAIENGIRDYLEENNTTKGKRLDEVERAMRTTATTPSEAGNKDEQAESSGSEAETEPARSFHRKLSTNRAIKNAVSISSPFNLSAVDESPPPKPRSLCFHVSLKYSNLTYFDLSLEMP